MNERSGAWVRTTAIAAAFAGSVNLLLLAPAVRQEPIYGAGVALLAAALLGAVAVQLMRRAAAPPLAPPWWWALAIGGLTLAGAGLAARNGLTDAALAGVTVLVAASAGAVIAAGPLTLLLVRRSASSQGIELPRGPALMSPLTIGELALDAHRSVTTGNMQVTAAEPLDPEHLNNMLFFAGALARSSDQRFAQALARRAGRGRVTGYRQTGRIGMSGAVDRHPVRIGHPERMGLARPERDGVSIGVEVDYRALGVITVDDELRPDAADVCAQLQRRAALTLLTDTEPTRTEALGHKVGIASHVADADAEIRRQHVVKAQGDGSFIVFAGERSDLNAPALAQSDLAITSWEEDSPLLPHAVTLTSFSVGTIAQSIDLMTGLRARIEPVRRAALGLSVAAAAVAATGLLPVGGAVVVSLVMTAVVVGLAVRQAGRG
ncbi:HAD family hydrolase [Nocardioides dubius]|uniref:HAD family hydrolase n=1 Tax=Nocardioides dubius TaxID=317019 RepID=UPI0031DB472C